MQVFSWVSETLSAQRSVPAARRLARAPVERTPHAATSFSLWCGGSRRGAGSAPGAPFGRVFNAQLDAVSTAAPPEGPHVVIEIDAAATHPLFLQGFNGYDGTPAGTPQTVGYNYYSWPQQAASVTVGLLYPVSLHVVPVTDIAQQAMWMGAQVEYAEAASTVTATGTINGTDVGTRSGVAYCESVGFEYITLLQARQVAYLKDTLTH